MPLIGVTGGIDEREDARGGQGPGGFLGSAQDQPYGDDPDLEPLGEMKLPVTGFRGLARVTLVDGSPFPEPRSIRGFVKGLLRAVVTRPGAGMASTPLRRFLTEHPHPAEPLTPYCKANELARDYRLGAEVCGYCRDRLAVCESLLGAPAVWVHPSR